MKRFRWLFPAACLASAAFPLAAAEEGKSPAPPPDPPAAGAPSPEVEALRVEIETLKGQIRQLQEQVQLLAAARGTAAPAAAAGSAAAPAAGEAVAPPPTAAELLPSTPGLPATGAGGAPQRSQSLLNPAISAVMQVIGNTSLSRSEEENGFDLSEAELALQSAVDPFTRVDLFLSFPAGETPAVEEGTITTLNLPGPLQLKGGRFKSAFGKWNTLHNHAFFTVDRPDALSNFLGEESLTNDGLSLSVLIPNPWDQYIDFIIEAGTARDGPAFNSDGRHLTTSGHLTWFLNTSDDSTLELGLSGTFGHTGATAALADDLAACGAPCAALSPRDTYASAMEGLDVTYKWKPRQLNVYKSFLWQNEYLRGRREVDVLAAGPGLDSGTVSSGGGYSYVEWQLSKRWRLGARYDRSGLPDSETAREQAASALVRFQPSEFQELRFQIKRTTRNADAAARFDGDRDDNQIFFEWIPVIGAHGAHKY